VSPLPICNNQPAIVNDEVDADLLQMFAFSDSDDDYIADANVADQQQDNQIPPRPPVFDNRPDFQSLDDPQFLALRNNFLTRVDNITQLTCQHCLEKKFVTFRPQQQVCVRCRHANSRLKFSADNNMDPGPAVPQLSDLTFIEQLLVAKVNPTMSIMRLPRGGQYSFKGHVINFPQNVDRFVTDLPRRIDQLYLLVLRRPNNNPELPPNLFTVNRQRVFTALTWLYRNNRYYHDIFSIFAGLSIWDPPCI